MRLICWHNNQNNRALTALRIIREGKARSSLDWLKALLQQTSENPDESAERKVTMPRFFGVQPQGSFSEPASKRVHNGVLHG